MTHDDLTALMARVHQEIDHWATTARRLDDLLGADLGRTPRAGLQEFDALTQHLEQLSAFTGQIVTQATAAGRFEPAAVVRAAESLSLAALGDRLSGRAARESVGAGECDMW